MPKAAPRPIFGRGGQSTLYWVAMQISQFFQPLVLAPNVEIVISGLPERRLGLLAQLLRHALLEHLQGGPESAPLRFADEKVNVLGHYDVPHDVETVPAPCLFQGADHCIPRTGSVKQRSPMVTTERDEVEITCLLVSFQTPGHMGRIRA